MRTLVRGLTGSGKTTFGYHSLTAIASRGEKGLFITPLPARLVLRADTRNLDFDLTPVAFLDRLLNSALSRPCTGAEEVPHEIPHH